MQPTTERRATPPHNADAQQVWGKTSPLLIVLAWLFVGIPLAWGVEQTAAKSLDLFRAPPQPAGVGQAAAPAPTQPSAPPQPAPSDAAPK